MKIFVTTDYDKCSYITAGKLYEVLEENSYGFIANIESGRKSYFAWNGCQYIDGHNWKRIEVGTLAELAAKPGDEVELVWNGILKIKSQATRGVVSINERGDLVTKGGGMARGDYSGHLFRVISRAANNPKTWGEMTAEEKGALLLAAHEGGIIENSLYGHEEWIAAEPHWADDYAYRVKPEPVVETITVEGAQFKGVWRMSQSGFIGNHTHRITFDTIDGEPDCSSVKMECV